MVFEFTEVVHSLLSWLVFKVIIPLLLFYWVCYELTSFDLNY